MTIADAKIPSSPPRQSRHNKRNPNIIDHP
jgi:hypothetical protein